MLSQIPRIIHRIWIDFDFEPPEEPCMAAQWMNMNNLSSISHIPEQYHERICKFHRDNLDMEGWFWDTKNAWSLFAQQDPEMYTILRTFKGSERILAVDTLRYYLMYLYGGYYCDLDCDSIKSLSARWLSGPLIIPKSVASHNFFLGSTPSHPFWIHALDMVKKRLQHPKEERGVSFLLFGEVKRIYQTAQLTGGLMLDATVSNAIQSKVLFPNELYTPRMSTFSDTPILHRSEATWHNCRIATYNMQIYILLALLITATLVIATMMAVRYVRTKEKKTGTLIEHDHRTLEAENVPGFPFS